MDKVKLKDDLFFDTKELSEDEGNSGKKPVEKQDIIETADLLPQNTKAAVHNNSSAKTTTTTTTTTIKKTVMMTAQHFRGESVASNHSLGSEKSSRAASEKSLDVTKETVQHLNKQLALFQKNNTQFYNLLSMINDSLDNNFGSKIPEGTDVMAKLSALVDLVNALEADQGTVISAKAHVHENDELRTQLDQLHKKIEDAESVLSAKESEIKDVLQTSISNLDTVRAENYRLTKLNIHVIEERQALQKDLDAALKKANDSMAQCIAQEKHIEELEAARKFYEKRIESLEQEPKVQMDDFAKLRDALAASEHKVAVLELSSVEKDQQLADANIKLADSARESDALHKDRQLESEKLRTDLQTQLDGTQKELAELAEELHTCKASLQTHAKTNGDLSKQITGKQLHIAELESEIVGLNEKISKLLSQEKHIQASIATKESVIEQTKHELSTVLVTLTSDRASFDKKIGELDLEIQAKDEQVKSLESSVHELQTTNAAFATQIESLGDAAAQLDKLQADNDVLRKEVEALHGSKIQVEDSFSQLVTAKDSLEVELAAKSSEMENIVKLNMDLQEKLREAQNHKEQLSVSIKELDNTKDALALLQAEKASLIESSSELMKQLEDSKTQLSTAESEIAALKVTLEEKATEKAVIMKEVDELKLSIAVMQDKIDLSDKTLQGELEKVRSSLESDHQLAEAELESKHQLAETELENKHKAAQVELENKHQLIQIELASNVKELEKALEAKSLSEASHGKELMNQIASLQTDSNDKQIRIQHLEDDLVVKAAEIEEKETEKQTLYAQLQELIKEQKESAAAMLTVASASHKVEQLEEELKSCKSEFQQLQEAHGQLQKELVGLKETHASLTDEHNLKSVQVASLSEAHESACNEIVDKTKEIGELKLKCSTLSDKLNTERSDSAVQTTAVATKDVSVETNVPEVKSLSSETDSVQVQDLSTQTSDAQLGIPVRSMSVNAGSTEKNVTHTKVTKTVTRTMMQSITSQATSSSEQSRALDESACADAQAQTDMKITDLEMLESMYQSQKEFIYDLMGTVDMYEKMAKDYEHALSENEFKRVKIMVWKPIVESFEKARDDYLRELEQYKATEFNLQGTVDAQQKELYRLRNVEMESEYRRVKAMIYKQIAQTHESHCEDAIADAMKKLDIERASKNELSLTVQDLEAHLGTSKRRIEELLSRVHELGAAKEHAFTQLQTLEKQVLAKSVRSNTIGRGTQTSPTYVTDTKVQTDSQQTMSTTVQTAVSEPTVMASSAALSPESATSIKEYRQKLYRLEERVISQLDDISQLEFELAKMRVTMSQDNEKITKLEKELRKLRDNASVSSHPVQAASNGYGNTTTTTTVHFIDNYDMLYPNSPSVKPRNGSLVHHPFFYPTESDSEKDRLIRGLQERLLTLEEQNNKQALALRRIQERLLLGMAGSNSNHFSVTTSSNTSNKDSTFSPPDSPQLKHKSEVVTKVYTTRQQEVLLKNPPHQLGLPTPVVSPVLPNAAPLEVALPSATQESAEKSSL